MQITIELTDEQKELADAAEVDAKLLETVVTLLRSKREHSKRVTR